MKENAYSSKLFVLISCFKRMSLETIKPSSLTDQVSNMEEFKLSRENIWSKNWNLITRCSIWIESYWKHSYILTRSRFTMGLLAFLIFGFPINGMHFILLLCYRIIFPRKSQSGFNSYHKYWTGARTVYAILVCLQLTVWTSS